MTHQTSPLLEGIFPEDATKEFFVGIHDLADEQGLPVESISVVEP